MKIIIFFGFLFIISQKLSSQPTGWFWANPQPTGNSITDIQFIENTVYTCGGIGNILKSANHGYNWSLLNSYTNNDFNDVNFINAETGYAAGVNIIMKTTNSGASWFPVFNNYRLIYSTDIVSPSVIFASNGKTIFRSTNAGNTWDSIASNFSTYQNYILNSFDFIDANTGFVVGYPDIVMRTTNGGVNWVSQIPSFNRSYSSIAFSNGIGLMTYSGVANGIQRTTNFGNNWVCVLCDSGSYDYRKNISFKGSVAIVSGYRFYYSTNTGITWNSQTNPYNSQYNISNCSIDDSNNVYLISDGFSGSTSDIYKSSNFGSNWSTLSKRYMSRTISSLIFVDSSTILAGVITNSYPPYDRGSIMRSTDAGITWDTTYRDSNSATFIRDFLKINNSIYFAFGDNGISIKSSNGGNSWNRINISTASFTKAAFAKNTIFVTSLNGGIFKSTDLGKTWLNDSAINGPSVQGIWFVNSITGFLAEGSRVRRTTNSGNSWEITYSGINLLSDIAFFDDSTGLMTDYQKRLYRTSNGGINWNILNNGQAFHNSINIVNNISYTAGDTGRIFKSTDKGETWTLQRRISQRNLKSIDFLNEEIGAVGGDAGTIILTYNGSTVGITNISSIVRNYHLKQNYPNPFNPSTKIQFAIPKNGFVTLKVYDMLGREVSTLVSQQLTTGTYNFDFNGANLTSGVYFYRLDVQGQFSETKRMLLVK